MSHSAVDKFGNLVIRNMRDRAIEHFDRLADAGYAAPCLQQLQNELTAMTADQVAVARHAVISAIDNGMHDFLFALGEHHDCDRSIQILVDGHDVAELSDGLHGEQFTEDGWIAKFGAYSESGDLNQRGE